MRRRSLETEPILLCERCGSHCGGSLQGEGGLGGELKCLHLWTAAALDHSKLETASDTKSSRFKAEYSHPFMNIDAIVVPDAADTSAIVFGFLAQVAHFCVSRLVSLDMEVKPIPPQWVNDVELDEFGHTPQLCFQRDDWKHLTAFPGLFGAVTFYLSRTSKGRDGAT